MPESEQQREERARTLAYAQGVRDAEVDGRLKSAEDRLNAINGSIKEHARNAAALRDSITDLGEKVDALAAAFATRHAIEADRNEQLKQANEKQISTKQFWLGVATICAMILVGYYAKSKGIG